MTSRDPDSGPLVAAGARSPLRAHRVLTTTRIEEAVSEGARVLSHHRLRVEDLNGFEAAIDAVDLDGTRLMHFDYRVPLSVLAPPLGNWYAVHVPLRGALRVRRRGHVEEVPVGTAAAFNPVDAIDMDWSRDLSLLVLWIARDHLQDRARDLLGRRYQGELTFDTIQLSDPGSVANLLIGCAKSLDALRGGPPGVMASEMRRTLLNALLLTQDHSHSRQLADDEPTGVAPIVHRLVREIDADPAADHSTATLVQRSGLSERSVQQWFRRETGTSPQAYVRKSRLAQARAAFLEPSPRPQTVSEVASDWGFTNIGRFTSQYRTEYGESPVETLRRARRGLDRPM